MTRTSGVHAGSGGSAGGDAGAGVRVLPDAEPLALGAVAGKGGELAKFMQRLTITHVHRWVEHRRRRRYGRVYQGRFKSFPMQDDDHFYTVMRYVERNPLRAGMVKQAEQWRWSSLGQRETAVSDDGEQPRVPLSKWPLSRPRGWIEWVNTPQTAAEEEAIRRATTRGRPLGDALWVSRTETRLGIPPLQPRGRPKKR